MALGGMMGKRVAFIGVLLGCLVTSVLGSPTNAAEGQFPQPPQSVSTVVTDGSNCIVLDALGNQIWFGETDPHVDALGSALQTIVDAHTDQTTGVAFCTHYEGAAIFVVAPGDDLLQEIANVALEYPDLRVIIRQSGGSISELFTVGAELLKNPVMQGIIVGVAPDMCSGGLLVTVAQEEWPLSVKNERLINDTVEAANGSPLPVKYERGGRSELSTRAVDSQPYWMGGELTYGSSACSSGVPIILDGVRRLLTAGHCTGSTFYNNGNFVGSTYTTSYPGNADFLGDWQLIQGSTYAARVFNGPLDSNSSLSISGAVWGGRPNGSGICNSGRTTGQICRYYVLSSYASFTWSGVTTGPLLRMKHDSTGTGTGADSNGWRPGDSGGPCYFSDGNEGVTAAGIVTGRDVFQPYEIYYCTQLTGVRSWNSTATVG